MHKDKKVDMVVVFTSTANNGFYNEFVDERCILGYTEKRLRAVWDYAGQLRARGLQTIIIFDDILGSVNFKSPLVNEVFSNHWHLKYASSSGVS